MPLPVFQQVPMVDRHELAKEYARCSVALANGDKLEFYDTAALERYANLIYALGFFQHNNGFKNALQKQGVVKGK